MSCPGHVAVSLRLLAISLAIPSPPSGRRPTAAQARPSPANQRVRELPCRRLPHGAGTAYGEKGIAKGSSQAGMAPPNPASAGAGRLLRPSQPPGRLSARHHPCPHPCPHPCHHPPCVPAQLLLDSRRPSSAEPSRRLVASQPCPGLGSWRGACPRAHAPVHHKGPLLPHRGRPSRKRSPAPSNRHRRPSSTAAARSPPTGCHSLPNSPACLRPPAVYHRPPIADRCLAPADSHPPQT